MIRVNNISKKFEDVIAVDNLSLEIKEGQVCGLIGTNGAGKSTFLRMVTGVIKADSGSIKIDEEEVYNNVSAKQKIFYISDEHFFFTNAKPIDMCEFYMGVYDNFDLHKFNSYMEKFKLPTNRKIRTFSKGMKKQLAVILAISSNAKYIFCDETFDGLDPVMRQGVKSIFSMEMEERGLTPIIASHNLREIEDICDHIGLLYNGGMIVSSNLDSMKLGIYKIQLVFEIEPDFQELEIVTKNKRGSLYTITVRGEIEDIKLKIQKLRPSFYEVLPLTLEEIFITETEAKGYDIKNLIK